MAASQPPGGLVIIRATYQGQDSCSAVLLLARPPVSSRQRSQGYIRDVGGLCWWNLALHPSCWFVNRQEPFLLGQVRLIHCPGPPALVLLTEYDWSHLLPSAPLQATGGVDMGSKDAGPSPTLATYKPGDCEKVSTLPESLRRGCLLHLLPRWLGGTL